MRIAGKTILVTGGARRIGAEIVRNLASHGANVAIHCNRSLDAATALAGEITREFNVSAWVIRQDLAVEDAGDALFAAAIAATGGRLDVIVNSASEYAVKSAEEMTDDDLLRARRIHVDSATALIRCLAGMPGDSPKAAVNILDARIERGDDPGHAPYMLAKRWLAESSRALAFELAPRLRINCVAPGAVLQADHEAPADIECFAKFNPMNAVGKPAEVAECVAFLLSMDFICGQTLFYDGGYHLRP